ncbi:MAG TPA: LuxR C-terminal-related transcriptional regulator [Dehalococcoidia bacterium]
MTSSAGLLRAREAFAKSAWREAWSAYAAALDAADVTLDDIEQAAAATHLMGDEAESRNLLARGYRAAHECGDTRRAARFAFWLGHSTSFTGETAQSNGWFARAREQLEHYGSDCVEQGYLALQPLGIGQLISGELEAAGETSLVALNAGRRYSDATLMAGARHLRGRALVRLGRIEEGMAVLDEIMVSLDAGEVSPLMAGQTYCGVLEACQEAFDIRRAREWTALLSRWCESQPDLVPYRGPCLVHRVEVMRFHGDWEDAIAEARRACDWLSLPTSTDGPGDAFYQLGELNRLRGDLESADEAYRQASRLGRSPQPGLAQLWLLRGQLREADAAIERALEEVAVDERGRQAELLAVSVEIKLGRGDTAAARVAVDHLTEIAAKMDVAPVRAIADQALGSVLISEGHGDTAVAPLRRSWALWQELSAPYEGARVRELIAAAYRSLGDEQSAAMEADAARWVFEKLGAACDLERLSSGPPPVPGQTGRLTQRESEVMILVAAGETNKAIAARLVISEHTVARHVQNMLQKLGLSSRAGLAAFAVEHGLTRSSQK